ncbi:MAG: response regulator [Myxococcales bacterium]|nr:response regulator [Myxococcales bacterium]
MRETLSAPAFAPPSVVSLVDRGRFDDAIELLGSLREEHGGTEEHFVRVSQWVRDAATTAHLAKVGARDAVLVARSLAGSATLDERFVFSLVDGVRTVDRLLDVSTLGHLRTAKALAALFERGDLGATQPRPSQPAPEGASDGSVIVADSNATQAALTRTMLRPLLARGTKLVSSNDGNEVLELARKSRPLLIVAEYMLSGIDGLELGRRLREDGATAGIPMVLVATRLDADALRSRLGAGGVLLVRPFDSRALREVLAPLVAGPR